MARFEVTISEMYNAASRIHQAADDYLTAACNASAAAEALAETWEGDSQVAFMQEQRQAEEWFRRMAELVVSYVQMIQRAARAYQQADEQATGAIGDGGGAAVHNWNAIMQPPIMMLYGAPRGGGGFIGGGSR